MFGKIDQSLLEFAAEQAGDTEGTKTRSAKGSIEAKGTKAGFRIDSANRLDELEGETSGRMHRDIKRYQTGFAQRLLIQWYPRQVEAGDLMASRAQPDRRRSQPEGLVAQFISRNQNDLHESLL